MVVLRPKSAAFGPIDLHRQLGRAASRLSRGSATPGVVKQVRYVLGNPPGLGEVLTANFDRHAAAAVVQPARHQLVDLVVAAAGIGAHDDARRARKLTP